ncbi:MAG: hypothetical protein AAF557_06100 [Pseudomonadota bacterium]
MNWDLALYDLIAPYVLRGAPLGPIHAAISVIRVQEYDEVISDDAVVIRGTCRFSGETGAWIDPDNFAFGFNAQNAEGHPRDDDGRRNPWIDMRDSNIAFEFTAPRIASQIIMDAADNLDPGDNADLLDLLSGLDPTPDGPAPSDYASTEFTLDMVVTAAVLRMPFLKGAELLDDGRLAPIAGDDRVEISLPRFKIRLTQGSDDQTPLIIDLLSFGVDGLDDAADIAVVDLIRMDPPYAFIGSSRAVGFGFRSATLDLSTNSTPHEVLEQFGFDASWTGLYLPEIRLFVAPDGVEDFAVSAGVNNLLIGWGAQPGITGDFDLAVIDQGGNDLEVGVRFIDSAGRLYGMTRTGESTATAQVPPESTMVVDVSGGRPPYNVEIDSVNTRMAEITFDPGESQTSVHIVVDDPEGPAGTVNLTIEISRYQSEVVVVTEGQAGIVEITEQTAIREGQTIPLPQVYIASQNATHVTLGLIGAVGDAEWSEPSVEPGDGPHATTFALGEEEEREVTVTLSAPDIEAQQLDAFFRFNEPHPDLTDLTGFALNPFNSSTDEAVSEGPRADFGPDGQPVMLQYDSVLRSALPGTPITIIGQASFEGINNQNKRIHNYDLSRQRALTLAHMIEAAHPAHFDITIEPPEITGDPPGDWVTEWMSHEDPRNMYWRAFTELPVVPQPEVTVTATIRRRAGVEEEVVEIFDPPPPEPSPPSWFRSARVKVRIVQNAFVAIEISGEIDFQTAAEDQIEVADDGATGQLVPTGLGQNASDGIVAYRLLVQVDDAAQTWTVSLALGADPADVNGLMLLGAPPNQTLDESLPGLNILGLTCAMAPVLSTTAPENPLNGDVQALALSAAAVTIPAALGALGWLTVQRVILYGGELLVRSRESGTEVNLLFDVETAISASIGFGDPETPPNDQDGQGGFQILTIPAADPLKVRYKSIGVRLGYTPQTGDRFQFRPVFDASKGYTIEVGGPGGIQVAEPLGRIMKVLAARLSRTNPMNFEIDLGFSADLGVISVERARVLLPINPIRPPQLTALAASIDIPSVIRASGYMQIGESTNADGVPISEIRGGLDLTIIPIKLRIQAEIAVAQIPEEAGGPATGVAVSIEVTFPAPIPLGSSGLGLLGVLGLFAMHYARNMTEFENDTTPALAWLEATGGNPTRLSSDDGSEHFWSPQVDSWAFGVGAVLGTAEGGFIFNMKGVFLLELPGPRILLMMKVAMLTPPPVVEGVEEAGGSLLAVIDLDAGRGTLTIGIVAEYAITPLFEIRIPIEAFFDLNTRTKWHIFIGSVYDPIQARVILVFEGSGYLMLSGDGISHPKFDTPIDGRLAVAAGMHLELIWGSKEIKIYASVAGGFDALIGFQPFFMQGKLEIRGELRLIIISIAAYAKLDLIVGEHPESEDKIARLDGMICGKIKILFIRIEGCVDFSLGDEPSKPIPDLVEKMTLISRSPALVRGTGGDMPIDAVLAEAIIGGSGHTENDFVEPSVAADDDTRPRRVPIDAVMALSLTASPRGAPIEVMDTPFEEAAPGSTAQGYTDRADRRVFYQLTGVDIVEGELTEGSRPATWWAGDPATKDTPVVQLALMTWVPSPFEKAIERSEYLEQIIEDRWCTVCHDPAPAAPVLWAFHEEPIGPSETGWKIKGKAWPDPEETVRSEDPDLEVEIVEAWRSGTEADPWRGILPAWIVANQIQCAEIEEDSGSGGITAGDGLSAGTRGPSIPSVPSMIDLRRERTVAANPGGFSAQPIVAAAGLNQIEIAADRVGRLSAQPADQATLELAAEMARFTGISMPEARTTNRLTVTSAFQRLTRGEEVDATAFLAIDQVHSAPPVEEPDFCEARILAAADFDFGGLVVSPLGDASREDDIVDAWADAGFEPSPLFNAIKLRSKPFVDAKLLIATFESFVQAGLVIARVLDANGQELAQFVPTISDKVPPRHLPPRWVDAAGPWFIDVDHAARFDNDFPDPVEGIFNLFMIDLPEQADAEYIEIGFGVLPEGEGEDTDPAPDPIPPGSGFPGSGGPPGQAILNRRLYLLCFEMTRLSEAQRVDYDQQLVQSDRNAVGRYLGLESGEHALLRPDTLYGIRVDWIQYDEDDAPGEGEDLPDDAEQSETFWFHTTAEPPTRLGPYMLFTLPNESEKHVFGQEPLKLQFSTPQVSNLFAAFDRQLQIRLRASSFRQPDPDDLPDGESYPFGLGQEDLEPVGPQVLSPFEEVLQECLEASCIEIAGDRIRHLERIIDVPLDPLTDYVLDIESVPISDPENPDTRTIVHSVSFSTGAYPTLERFVRGIQAVPVNHRWVATGAMQLVANAFPGSAQPEGPELDAAMIAAELEPMPVPDRPETTVFWEHDGSSDPVPVAIMIDAPEPMQRTWSLPTKVVDKSVEPSSEYWANADHEWLGVEEGANTPGMVPKVIMAPGGQRVLAILANGARGEQVAIDLVRRELSDHFADPEGSVDIRFPIVDVILDRAPWEE